MHYTVKKTTKLIIEGGNDYVITVKGNQPRLLTQLKTIATGQNSWEQFVEKREDSWANYLSNRESLY